MTDKYASIRSALERIPHPGPWYLHGPSGSHHTGGGYISASADRHAPAIVSVHALEHPNHKANSMFVAACDPDTIRELLTERDRMRSALNVVAQVLESDDPAITDTLWVPAGIHPPSMTLYDLVRNALAVSGNPAAPA